jgi:hypothetical protein
VHLFLIPLEPANGDSQMIFVLAKHTPFAAGAKRRNRARKIHQISKNLGWDAALHVWAALSLGSRSASQLQKRQHAFTDVRGQHTQGTRV